MALDYITIGISLVIFIFYLITFFLLIETRKRLTKEAGLAFIYFMVALFILVIRRLQQIFVKSDMMTTIPYFADFVTLVFAIFFFLAILIFYRSLKRAGSLGRSVGESFKDYKRNLGRKIIR